MSYRMENRSDVPWHGLGTPVHHDATPQEMLVEAGLDWTVSKRPTRSPRTLPVGSGEWDWSSTIPVDDFFALVRDSDDKVLGPCGKDYIPTQNRQAFEFFKKFTEAGKMRLETAGSLQGGTQVWVLAKLLMTFTLPGGDEVRGYLLFNSPHVWGKSLTIKFVTIRVVCANTLAMAMSESKYGKGFRAPHVRAFDSEVAKEAELSLGIATELFTEFEATAVKLSKARASDDVVVRYVADVFQKELITEQFGKDFYKQPELEQARLLVDPTSPRVDTSLFKRTAYEVLSAVNRQPGAGLESSAGTLWGGFNAISYYCDFLAGRDRDNALTSSWFGPRAATKARAWERAAQLAEAIEAK
jgi:phage/plasmid-like protein (TIGR03299 family)